MTRTHRILCLLTLPGRWIVDGLYIIYGWIEKLGTLRKRMKPPPHWVQWADRLGISAWELEQGLGELLRIYRVDCGPVLQFRDGPSLPWRMPTELELEAIEHHVNERSPKEQH